MVLKYMSLGLYTDYRLQIHELGMNWIIVLLSVM
jgi:hypothetical protein